VLPTVKVVAFARIFAVNVADAALVSAKIVESGSFVPGVVQLVQVV
jgi:hypothetical protein